MNLLNRLHQTQFLGNPTILAVCLALPCLTASAGAETYDARVDGTQILTPPAGPVPAINGPEVYGVRPGSPVIRLYMERENDSARISYQRLGFNETGYEVLELLFPISD